MTDFGVPAFSDLLSPADRAAVVALGRRQRYRAGETIHERGDPRSSMGVVVSGGVRLVRLHRDGHEMLTSKVNKGQNYGDLMIGMERARTHRAVAAANTLIDHYDAEAFARLLEIPGALLALYRVAAFRLERALEQLDDQKFAAPEVRLARLLLIKRSEPGMTDQLAWIQDDIAGLLGLSTVTVAKSLRKLKDAGLIATGYREVSILDAEGLQNWLDARDVG